MEAHIDPENIPLDEEGLGALFDSLSEIVFEDGEDFEIDIPEAEIERLAAYSAAGDDDIWNGLTGDMMRQSCAFFASEVLSGPPEAPYNGRFMVAEHHEEWDQLLADHDRICVQAPRDHGKTFFFDFAFPIWKSAFIPNGKGYIFSATQPQAVRILEDIKEEIESNPKLQWLVPKNKKKWSSTAITLANGHKIYARGYGTKIRGAHPDWIVVDDGLNDEDAYSELVRQKHIDYFYTAITNMIIPGGQIVVVGTPFHAADLYADLSKNEKYCFRKYPALHPQTEEALWPDRYCATDEDQKWYQAQGINVTSLESRRKEIGNVRFTREFLVEPISDDMSLFPGHLFRGEPTEQFHVKLGQSAAYWDEIGVTSRFIGVDFAMSSSTAADYTVVFVMGTDRFQNRWVVDILRAKGLAYQQQLSLIKAAAKKYDPDMIFLESNQMQRIFGDELIRTTDLPIHKFTTTGVGKYNPKQIPKGNTSSSNKNSLEGGVPNIRVLLENGKFRIPRGDARSIEVTDSWIEEMKHFTWLEGKLQGVGSHDDQVMACWIADQAVRRGSFSFSDGSEEDYGSINVDDLIQTESEEAEADYMTQSIADPIIAALIQEAEESEGNGQSASSGQLVDDMDMLPEDDAHSVQAAAVWSYIHNLKH